MLNAFRQDISLKSEICLYAIRDSYKFIAIEYGLPVLFAAAVFAFLATVAPIVAARAQTIGERVYMDEVEIKSLDAQVDSAEKRLNYLENTSADMNSRLARNETKTEELVWESRSIIALIFGAIATMLIKRTSTPAYKKTNPGSGNLVISRDELRELLSEEATALIKRYDGKES